MGEPGKHEIDRLGVVSMLRRASVRRDVTLTAIVKSLCAISEAEIGLISLIDLADQRFLAVQGLGLSGTHRAVSFCSHTIRQAEPMQVSDASNDDRFRYNPLVLSEPHIRSYLGAPITVDGQRVGALCVISPRTRAFDKVSSHLLLTFAAEAADAMDGWRSERRAPDCTHH